MFDYNNPFTQRWGKQKRDPEFIWDDGSMLTRVKDGKKFTLAEFRFLCHPHMIKVA